MTLCQPISKSGVSGRGPMLKALFSASVSPKRGRAVGAFTRTVTGNVLDFEGILHTAKINELRFPLQRRVENLLAVTEVAVTETVNVVSGRSYIYSFTGTGTVTFSGAATGSIVGTGSGRDKITIIATSTSLTITVSGSVLKAQLVLKSGNQTDGQDDDYVSKGVLPWPYHGCGVDGVKYFNTDRSGRILEFHGALIERSAINLITYSSDFSSWSKVSATVTTNQATAPDGTTSADLISLTSGSGYVVFSNISSSSSTNTFSIWLRSVSGTGTFTLNWYDFSSHHREDVILTTTWTRFELSITAKAFNVYAGDDRANTATLKACYAWGAQVETGSRATSNIPTSGNSVTRTADTHYYSVYDLITQGQGSLYFEFNLSCLPISGDSKIISLNDGTSSNRLVLAINSTGACTLTLISNSVTVATITTSVLTIENLYKALISYEDDNIRLYVNGSLVDFDDSCTIPNFSKLNVLSDYNNIGQSNGLLKNLKYFRNVIGHTEAERMTV